LLSKDMLRGSEKPLDQLRAAQAAIDSLMSLWANADPTCGAVLENVVSTNLFTVPDSLKAALAAVSAKPTVSADEEADPGGENVAALLALLDCQFSMIAPYASYVAREASFDTHQGVKGLEFDRVMVL
ncbi:ATP-dependent helicase, partial [Rhizobium ruizarguesonis]